MVYRLRQHVIDVHVSTAATDRGVTAQIRRGFNLEHFSRGGMNYWIVFDLNKPELDTLTQLLAAQSTAHQW